MSRVPKRRWKYIAFFLLALLLLLIVDRTATLSIRDTVHWSGWILLVLIVGLALYNVRKRLAFLPMVSSKRWLQIHIVAGLLTIPVFAMHIRWYLPNGIFEMSMALLYIIVVASGIGGLVVSRSFAKRMTTRGSEEVFERIPRRQNHLLMESERLVLECLHKTESTAVPEFYASRLRVFLQRPRHFISHLMMSTRPRRELLMDMEAQKRYLNPQEEKTFDALAEYVKLKDDLDFQFAHQATLKFWLFVHVPLTYALLAFATLHLVLVHAYSGDLP